MGDTNDVKCEMIITRHVTRGVCEFTLLFYVRNEQYSVFVFVAR